MDGVREKIEIKETYKNGFIMNESRKIVVVGSSNTDMTVQTERVPRPGETVLGGLFYTAQGGKGANQAVAAARLGGEVCFVAKVGGDSFGEESIKAYRKEGIDTSLVGRSERAASGVALIMVDGKGENSIAVASGANAELSVEDIVAAEECIKGAQIVLMQLETPIETIAYAARLAAEAGVKAVLNPAPAATLPKSLYKHLYMITPNETEAELLTGIAVTDIESAAAAADVLAERGVKVVIITLGSKGAFVREASNRYLVPGQKVKAVDTTAAGDTFNGALCVALAEGAELVDAVDFANKAAAIGVTRRGAQPSIPTRVEIKQYFG